MTTSAGTVLITGSSSGFGRAAAGLFVERGWNVVATARSPTGEQLADRSERLLVLPLDVRDPTSIGAAVAGAIDRFGHLDCVVNNAGAGLFSVFEATPMDAVRDLFETNVFGMMQVTQAVLPHFRSRGVGRVVNVSSGSGIVPEPLMAVYSATKFAVEGFSEALRSELAGQHVVVKLVEPGLVVGTNFLQRTAQASAAVPVPTSYQALVDQTMTSFTRESPLQLGTETTVAEAIVAAATQDTDQLRYVVGEDTQISARMRRETCEQDYNAWAVTKYAAAG